MGGPHESVLELGRFQAQGVLADPDHALEELLAVSSSNAISSMNFYLAAVTHACTDAVIPSALAEFSRKITCVSATNDDYPLVLCVEDAVGESRIKQAPRVRSQEVHPNRGQEGVDLKGFKYFRRHKFLTFMFFPWESSRA